MAVEPKGTVGARQTTPTTGTTKTTGKITPPVVSVVYVVRVVCLDYFDPVSSISGR